MSAADKACGSTCPRNANFRALRSRHWSQRHLVGKSLLVERNWVRFVQTGFGQRPPISRVIACTTAGWAKRIAHLLINVILQVSLFGIHGSRF